MTTTDDLRATAAEERPFGNWFSFSFSGWKTYRRCPREWWLRKVLFWRGWEKGTTPARRRAYGLTKMNTVWTLSGKIVHEIAAGEISGQRRRIPEAAVDYYRFRMSRGWNESESGAWAKDPKRKVNLFEHYYELPNAARLFGVARSRGEAAVRNLFSSPALELRERGRVIVSEQLEQMMLGDVPVWIQLDAAVEVDGLTWVVDWKSGKPRKEDRVQATLYAVFLHDVRGVPVDELRVAIAYLVEKHEEVFSPTLEEMDAVREAVHKSALEIRELLEPPADRNKAEASAFPPIDDPAICSRCEMFHACKGSRHLPRTDS